MRERRRLLPGLIAALVLAATTGAAVAAQPYKAEITLKGLDDDELSEAIEAASQLVALQDKPPGSAASLRRRADDDLPRLAEVMHAVGYWTPKLSDKVDTEAKPARVTVTIEPGPALPSRQRHLPHPRGRHAAAVDAQKPGAVGLEIGAPRARPGGEAETKIVEEYARHGRPFAKVTDRKAVVDIAKHTMSVTYTVVPGRPPLSGPLAIKGLDRVEPKLACVAPSPGGKARLTTAPR